MLDLLHERAEQRRLASHAEAVRKTVRDTICELAQNKTAVRYDVWNKADVRAGFDRIRSRDEPPDHGVSLSALLSDPRDPGRVLGDVDLEVFRGQQLPIQLNERNEA